jgi:hypothetical protein
VLAVLAVLVVISMAESAITIAATSSATAAMLLWLHGDSWRRTVLQYYKQG